MVLLFQRFRQPIRQLALASQSFLCRRVTEKLAAIVHAGVGVSKARCQPRNSAERPSGEYQLIAGSRLPVAAGRVGA
jgi:hypothetical protein